MFVGIATDQWGVIAAGLGIGILARAAYLMSLRKPVWRDLVISLIVAPMNGALTAELVSSLHLADSKLLLAAALLGSSSTMAFMGARKQFLRWHGNDRSPAQVFADPDSTTAIPPGTKGAEVVAVSPETPDSTAAVTKRALARQKPVTDEDAEMKRLLGKLDEF